MSGQFQKLVYVNSKLKKITNKFEQPKMIWCHSCQKETTISEFQYVCSMCGSPAIENTLSAQDLPNSFQPYVIGGTSLTNTLVVRNRKTRQFNFPYKLASELPGQFTVIRIVSPNFGPMGDTRTPVSKQTIEKLERVENVSQCSVCQEEGGNGLKLGCSHSFHDQCLKPWLEQANTCPTCRKEIQ